MSKPRRVTHILSSTFHPLPTIKTIQKHPDKQLIYHAAHHLFRHYPLHTPLLIYQYQSNQTGYDFYIERTEKEWKDTVHQYPIPSKLYKITYMISGLSQAMEEEKTIQPHLAHMAQQLDMMCRLLNI
jgi:hypothetical protein